MKRLLALCLFLLAIQPLSAQQQPCKSYDCVIKRAKAAIAAKNYQQAFDNLESAEGYPNAKINEVRALRKQLFNAVENDKQAAIAARDEAKKQKDLAEKQTKLARQEKLRSDSLFNLAEAQREKAEAVLDKIYFYEDRFGLAYEKKGYGDGFYGFIDKNLKTKIPFVYQEAQPFDDTGFSKVKRDGIDYLIDTLGNKYQLATNIDQLNPNVIALDLRNKGLFKLPQSIFSNTQLEVLILNLNPLGVIPNDIGKLKNLKILLISSCQLKEISIESTKLNNLERLDLSYNSISELPEEVKNLRNIKELNINHNRLKKFPKAICRLENLSYLDISNNILDSLPVEIEQLTNLQTFKAGFNKINHIPTQIGNLTRLKYFDIGVNRIKSIPDEIGRLSALYQLNLGSNMLLNIPKSIENLQNLKFFILSFNNIAHLPNEIENLTSLQVLDLSVNSLINLPENIHKLDNLKYLYVFKNNLKSLPLNIHKLSGLEEIDLSNNKFIDFPAPILKLSNLKKLEYASNRLREIPIEIKNLSRLEILDLSDCGLRSFPKAVCNVEGLEVLMLGENHITTLDPLIQNLKNLKHLRLPDNAFKTFPSEVVELEKLQSLDLGNNGIEMLPTEIKLLKNIEYLYLNNNYIRKIPHEIGRLSNLSLLDLSDNELGDLPEEICKIPYVNFAGNIDLHTIPSCIQENHKILDFVEAINQRIVNTLDSTRLYPLYARLVDTLEARFVKDTALRLDLGEACAKKAWFSLLAGQYAAGEAAARRSMVLTHLEPQIKCTLAHTLLFQNRFEEAKAIYLDFTDDAPGNTDFIFDDFEKLRRNDVTHPDMQRIEALLGG